MKKAFILILGALAGVSAYAQGTITFSNFGVEIKTDRGENPAGFVIGLYLQGNDTPLAVTTFLEGTGFIQPPDADVVVPGHPVNSTDAVFVVRAWEAGLTFLTSCYRGESATFSAGPLGGPNGANPPTISPAIDNLQAFIIFCPEPATIALGALGLGAVLVRRRR